jgi:hypothetical protein
MLLKDIRLWPDDITPALWPLALQLAVDVHSHTPSPSGLSPIEIFSKHKDSNRLKDFHPFGGPVVALKASLQKGHKIPKWQPRSRMAIYLGNSTHHAINAHLVLNIQTGLVSPQYHVVFDDNFTTTKSIQPNETPSNWPGLYKQAESFLGEDCEATHTISPAWKESRRVHFVDELDIRTSNADCQLPVSTTSLPQREHRSSMKHTTSSPAVSPPVSAPNWPTAHQYNTRFR